MSGEADVGVRADALRAEAARLRASLQQAESAIAGIEARCDHRWSDPVRTSEPYMAEGVGELVTRGSDAWHEPRYYPSTRLVWRRRCRLCHRTEETRATKPVTHQVPAFG